MSNDLTGLGAAATTVAALLFCQPALADTLESALAYAYVNNPQLNSQRALVRATDESVPTALAGYRPARSHRWREPAPAAN